VSNEPTDADVPFHAHHLIEPLHVMANLFQPLWQLPGERAMLEEIFALRFHFFRLNFVFRRRRPRPPDASLAPS
jgi:hypothetical protein